MTFVIASLAIAQAQDGPDSEFSPVDIGSDRYVIAKIGARKSLREGDRASIKWLSHLIREQPRETNYMVQCHMVRGGKKISISMRYDSEGLQLSRSQSLPKPVKTHGGQRPMVPLHEESWQPVSIQQLHAVAKKGGTTVDFNIYK